MWLTDYRRENNLELYELGEKVRRAGRRKNPALYVSDLLLHRLEVDPNFRTVPRIANLIAEVCWATPEQRDALVLDKYRGTWKRPARRPEEREPVKPVSMVVARQTLVIDREGNEIARFPSTSAAAMRCGISQDTVCRRCNRRIDGDEFQFMGYTFRYSDEWEGMSPDERKRDLRDTPLPRGQGRGPKQSACRPVTVITRDGAVRHYKSCADAALATGVKATSVSTRVSSRKFMRNANLDGNMYLYRDTWEEMTEEQRRTLLTPAAQA